MTTLNRALWLPVESRRDDYQKDKDAQCAAQGANHEPPKHCHAEVTTVSTGSDAGGGDDTFGFVCVCK
jgi:hypothetical protein